MIVGLDIGRSSVKVFTGDKMEHFPSYLGEWRKRKLSSEHKDDIEVEFQGEKYFAGMLAQNESEFARSMMTEEKAHADTLLLALIALHRVTTEANIITGLPVYLHDTERKNALKQLLRGNGKWEITVNGVRKTISVPRIEVAVEGGAAFWSSPRDGLVRVIDAGSRTVNYVTLKDKRYVDRDSGTLPFGFGTTISGDLRQMAARIAGELGRKWRETDAVLVAGGRAEELAKELKQYFPQTETFTNPLFANAIGYYRIGRKLL